MKEINKKSFPLERALYGAKDLTLKECSFKGIEDGESALKEASNIKVIDSLFSLRYPLRHDFNVTIIHSLFEDTCRAALWYSSNIIIDKSELLGIKALRECKDIEIFNSLINSPEFGWKSKNITLFDDDITSEYLFLESENIKINNIKFNGKYSFQYVKDVEIVNSYLDTKDAFWHSNNVIVKNSVVKGEYLGWYSTNLTLINCKIIGTQPLCYAKNLKLIDCEMIDCDFAFEYSEVESKVLGNIKSIKNPYKGRIVADNIEEVIITSDSKYPNLCEIVTKN